MHFAEEFRVEAIEFHNESRQFLTPIWVHDLIMAYLCRARRGGPRADRPVAVRRRAGARCVHQRRAVAGELGKMATIVTRARRMFAPFDGTSLVVGIAACGGVSSAITVAQQQSL